MGRFAPLLTVLAVLPVAVAQSELGSFLATALRASVVEEAVNPSGTHFVLLNLHASARRSSEAEAALQRYMEQHESGSLAVVFPATTDRPYPHDVSFGLRGREGVVFTSTSGWMQLVQNAQTSGSSLSDFSTANLEHTFGESRFLNQLEDVRPRPGRSPPRNGCVSSTSATGSTMTCYTDGRVTYRSTCTIDSQGNITCRSESY